MVADKSTWNNRRTRGNDADRGPEQDGGEDEGVRGGGNRNEEPRKRARQEPNGNYRLKKNIAGGGGHEMSSACMAGRRGHRSQTLPSHVLVRRRGNAPNAAVCRYAVCPICERVHFTLRPRLSEIAPRTGRKEKASTERRLPSHPLHRAASAVLSFIAHAGMKWRRKFELKRSS